MILFKVLLPLILKIGLVASVFGGIAFGYHAIESNGKVKAEYQMLQDVIKHKNEVLDTQQTLTKQAYAETDEARKQIDELKNAEVEREVVIQTVEAKGCNLDAVLPAGVID